MQTQCPHCETSFRVTRTQVEAADGFVRCGICQEVFNAIEVASQHEHQQPLLDNTAAQSEARNDINIDIDDIDNEPDQRDTTHARASDDAFDLFDEVDNESLQHVVPEKYRDTYSSSSSSLISTLLWGIGTLILTATLIVEYVWYNRSQFNHITELQTVFEKTCQYIECQNLHIRDAKKIELVSRNVYSHPHKKGALMVNVTLSNQAEFAQPYPVMQVNFSDIRGGSVAARRFHPYEYLQLDDKRVILIQPGVSTDVSLEIKDPGKQAMTYEFNFL